MTVCELMLTHTAVRYFGASLERTMYEPAMPPRPLHALIAAATVARFHWPVMLLAWYADRAAQFETYAPVARKVPMYRTVVVYEKPNMQNPTITQSALKVMTGPRREYLSANHEERRTGMTLSICEGVSKHGMVQ